MAIAPSLQVEVSIQDCYFYSELGESELGESDDPNSPALTESVVALDPTLQSLSQPDSALLDPPEAAIAIETWEIWFQRWLTHLNPSLSPINQYELSLRLTHDAEIQALNASYRLKDQPTDVLAFASLETDMPQPAEMTAEMPLYLGDIVISVETAQHQAQERDHSLTEELAWLATHGLLHLLGWDHPDEDSLRRMLNQQAELLQTVDLKIDYDEP